MNNLYIQKASNSEAKDLIVKNHYTHKWTIAELCLGLYKKEFVEGFFDTDKLLGVIIFGPTAGANVAKSISPLLNASNTWELKRLWVDDCLGKNTESWFISQAIDYIKNFHSNIKCIISYADPDAGHIGTIYAAANFIYQNIERPKGTSGYVVSFDGGKKWVHGRTLFNKYGSFEFNKLVAVLPRPFWIKELSVKERYVYPLGNKIERKELLKSMNYKSLRYPKKKLDKEKITEYV
jgi:hypothetical protein